MCLGKVEGFRIKDEIRSQDKAAVSELPRGWKKKVSHADRDPHDRD